MAQTISLFAFATSGFAADAEKALKTIEFKMPADGFVSLNIQNANGEVVRQLLTCEPFKAGKHEVAWDGLTTPVWKTPGTAVPAGKYTWSALWHTGIGLKLRGWAYHGSSDPWDNGPTTYWGADHALPTSCDADTNGVYLTWAGSEAGKALIACDLDFNVKWASGQGFDGGPLVACDRDIVYFVKYGQIRRVDAHTGQSTNWPGRDTAEIPIGALFEGEKGMPSQLTWAWQEGFAARNGLLYLSFSAWDWQRSDITDWRPFLTQMKAEPRVGKAIWDRIDQRSREQIDKFLGNQGSEEDLFKAPNYYTPDVRDAVIGVLRALLDDKGLVEGADKLSREALAEANRRLIEKTFPDCTIKAQSNFIAVVDATTFKVIKKIFLDVPGKLAVARDDLAYVFSGRTKLLALNPQTGETRPFLANLISPGAVTVDKDGDVYVASQITGEKKPFADNPDYFIQVFSPDAKLLRTIGRKEGRVNVGPWDPTGLTCIWGLCVDPKGQLWVAELSWTPKRFVVFNAKTGAFVRELIGGPHYGAGGGTVNPRDPNILVGEGCEFRIDPATGQSRMTGIISPYVYHGSVRFADGSNGRQYLGAFFSGRIFAPGEPPQIRIWERVGEGDYAYRAVIRAEGGGKGTIFWADENGDGVEQPNETQSIPQQLGLAGYLGLSLTLNTDLTLYSSGQQFKVAGFTACGAPKYDLKNIKALPALSAPLASPDNRLVASCEEKIFRCFDVATGKQRWTYPSTFSGVHGSHYAPGPITGMIRGAFGFVGSGILPKPVGAIWAINSNVGEWHLLTEDGFYLTRLFQPDAQKWVYPKKAAPGVDVTEIPPGLGGEDFGGSLAQGRDGKLYIQAGKVALWDLEVTGLESVKAIKGGKIKVSARESIDAALDRDRRVQAASPSKSVTIKKATPAFTGNMEGDFRNAEIQTYQKQESSRIRTAASWDDANLYIGWQVTDDTPWTNAADTAETLYTRGDTVDFQLGTDPGADSNRTEAVKGDLRLSIGNLRGTPTAVLFRRVSDVKKPKRFSSGVLKDYTMELVDVLPDVKITVKPDPGPSTSSGQAKGYTVEAAIPQSALGLKIADGLVLRGDFGATHGDVSGSRPALRTYWNNQATGIVNDEVFELKLEPRNWGTIFFKP